MRGPEGFGDADAGFVAGYAGQEERAARGVRVLGRGEDSGEDYAG